MKFYSWDRDFGYVLYCNPEKKGSTLLECRLNKSDWDGASTPDKGEWILFKEANGNRGKKAKKAHSFNFDWQGLLIAMEYRAENAYIKGRDQQGDTHNINVLCHTISAIQKQNSNWEDIVVSSFAEYLSPYTGETLKEIIKEFLLDNQLCKVLIGILPKFKSYQNENVTFTNGINELCSSVEEIIFSKKDIDILSALPSDFDFNPYEEQVLRF